MRRGGELEAAIVAKYSAVAPVLDERSRRRWAAAESLAIGYGGDALVSSATGLARETVRNGRREIARAEPPTSRIRAPGAGRPGIDQDPPANSGEGDTDGADGLRRQQFAKHPPPKQHSRCGSDDSYGRPGFPAGGSERPDQDEEWVSHAR